MNLPGLADDYPENKDFRYVINSDEHSNNYSVSSLNPRRFLWVFANKQLKFFIQEYPSCSLLMLEDTLSEPDRDAGTRISNVLWQSSARWIFATKHFNKKLQIWKNFKARNESTKKKKKSQKDKDWKTGNWKSLADGSHWKGNLIILVVCTSC